VKSKLFETKRETRHRFHIIEKTAFWRIIETKRQYQPLNDYTVAGYAGNLYIKE
jgi:hypothetical protein